jgi:hypothetical protein
VAALFVRPLPELLGCCPEGSKRSIIFAVGGLSFRRTCRCTVASHSGGHHAVYNRAVDLRTVPTMACSLPVQAGALPGLSATDARGVAAAGDMKERGVSHFRSEKAPLVRAKGVLARGKGPDWRKDGVRHSFERQFRTQDLLTASQGAFPRLIALGSSLPLRTCRSLCGRAF